MRQCIFLYGPTAVGKTDLSIEIAKEIKAEIINMDVGQFYVPFTIGTAKPDWKKSEVPHHYFDILNEPRNFSIIEYRKGVQKIIDEIHDRGKVPLFVGGSGFYLYSLLFEQRNNIKSDEALGEAISWEKLNAVDQERAAQIHPRDTYRIQRAFLLYKKSGGSLPSTLKPTFAPICPYKLINIERDRADLYSRINFRTKQMFQEGFENEVSGLLGTVWESFMVKKKLIGYNELVYYFRTLDKNISSDESIEQVGDIIAKRTRNYAKRQGTFFRYLCRSLEQSKANKKDVYTINVSQISTHKVLKDIVQYIKI